MIGAVSSIAYYINMYDEPDADNLSENSNSCNSIEEHISYNSSNTVTVDDNKVNISVEPENLVDADSNSSDNQNDYLTDKLKELSHRGYRGPDVFKHNDIGEDMKNLFDLDKHREEILFHRLQDSLEDFYRLEGPSGLNSVVALLDEDSVKLVRLLADNPDSPELSTILDSMPTSSTSSQFTDIVNQVRNGEVKVEVHGPSNAEQNQF